jgi:hypothetical protein
MQSWNLDPGPSIGAGTGLSSTPFSIVSLMVPSVSSWRNILSLGTLEGDNETPAMESLVDFGEIIPFLDPGLVLDATFIMMMMCNAGKP